MVRERRKVKPPQKAPTYEYEDFLRKMGISPNDEVQSDQEIVKKIMECVFEDCDDFVIQYVRTPGQEIVYLYYFKGIVAAERIQEELVHQVFHQMDEHSGSIQDVIDKKIASSMYMYPGSWKDCIQNCLKGQVICHVQDVSPISLSFDKKEKRSLSEPTTEYQVYGPKIGFIEDNETNIGMMRKLLPDPRLKVRQMVKGTLSHTNVTIMYLEEYVDSELLHYINEKFKNLDIENLMDGTQLMKAIIDQPSSIFPQVYETERPDVVSFAMSQGKIVVFVDHSNFAFIVPITLANLIEIGADNFRVPWDLTFIRLLRFASMIVATLLPALYVSLVGFHPELLPTTLALTIAESRNNIPFPVFTEAFLMIFALDILVEASIRLPSNVGQTIGIVGGLVMGQAAVEAGLVSTTMIIVSSATAISSFTLPTWHLISSWRLVRYFLLFFSAFLGLYGFVLGIGVVVLHLCHLRSFSVPYLSPFSPFNRKEFQNMIFRGTFLEKGK